MDIVKAMNAYLAACEAIREAIAAAGPDGIPNGHLWAMVMGKIDFKSYNSIIDMLIETGWVKQQHFVLTAVKK